MNPKDFNSTIFADSASKKNSVELEELAKNDGYDSIRFFVAPDKTVSPESVIEDVKAYFTAKNEGLIKPYKIFE